MPLVRVTSAYVDGDRRVEPEWSIEQLSGRLEPVTGVAPEFQRLQFKSETGAPVTAAGLTPATTLAEIGVGDGWHVHVEDTRPEEQRLDLTADAAPRPGMSYEEYSRRDKTLLQWKRENQLGRFGQPQPAGDAPAPAPVVGELTVPVGGDCFVRLVGGKTVRGVVQYHGPVSVLPPGPWVGVRLLSADGLNDGTVKGVRLFEARPGHGVVVRPAAVRPVESDEEEL